jgi:hypothetical protein
MNLQFHRQNVQTIDAINCIPYAWRNIYTANENEAIVLVTILLHLKDIVE